MNKNILLLSALIMLLFGSCEKFLNPYPVGLITGEDLWKHQEDVQGLITRCYDLMSTNYNNNEGAYLDGATDDAVLTSPTNALHKLATGSITTTADPFLTYWDRDYKAIALANLFLKDRRGINTHFMRDAHFNDLVRNRLQGEAFGLRAWYQWDLLQKFGGKGVNGTMLGFPIILEPVDPTAKINLARNTYDECVAQIKADCDSAYQYLPLAYRDFLVKVSGDLLYAGGKYWGRIDGITTRAIKANMYLTWASPRFNPGKDVARWDSAAANAKKVIDFKLNVDGASSVSGGFKPVDYLNWFNPNAPGLLIASRNVSNDDAMERMFYPGGFQGNGVMGATQELVNSFPMANGYPIDDPANRGLYDATKPYNGRDPRFYSTIFYNTAQAKKNNTGAVMYTFENWTGGKDQAGSVSSNSLTNYHIKKFVYMGLNWTDASISRQPHVRFFIRWENMCLAFAEAANQVVGPVDITKYGMSARTAIQYLRERKTQEGANGISPVVPGNPDAYLLEVAAAGKDAFDSLVKNERRLETCFEGLRFFDLRRWSTDLTGLNNPVHGAVIIQVAGTPVTYTYNLNNVVEARSYTSAYLPIPYSEMLRMSNLIQNEGWNGWN